MRSTGVGWLVGLVGMGVLGGCKGPVTHVTVAPPPTLATGWTMAESKEDGVSVGVVPGWHEGVDQLFDMSLFTGGSGNSTMGSPSGAPAVDPSGMANGSPGSPGAPGGQPMDPKLSKMMEDLNSMSKEERQYIKDEMRDKRGILLQIIDSSRPIPGEQRTRYFIRKVDTKTNVTLEDAIAFEQDELKGTGATEPKIVYLPIGKVARIDTDAKTRAGDEETRIRYIAADGQSIYLLGFISTNNPTAIRQIADEVAKTWRVTPSN